MSVDQLQQPRATPRGDTKLVQYDEYIDRQVENTRRTVKIVDLATSFVLLTGGVLAYLLVVAMVEHWLVPGGFSELARLGLFLVLAWGVGSFVIRRFWPLIVGRVNPIYAAHAIEVAAETGPSLKNSLVNLLLFRQKRGEISDAVYHTLEEQAAQRLSRVPLDAAVDRTTLIRFGYLLVAIVAVAALYKVFSPKDPIVAAQRVLMPWADIVPASRVRILDVKPGTVTVSRGEFMDVSAEVRGVGDDDNVVLRFTTADGQAVDKSAPMKLSRDNLRYEGRLPAEQSSAGEMGLAEDFTYRIEAGDARTLDYVVKVVDAPSILVERIEYDYPEYTGQTDRVVKERGDIQAIEGTRITVHARANSPIKEAHVDFDADGRRELTMLQQDAQATVSFQLALRDDRRTPEHASYVLRFADRDGRPNRNPVKHSIDVRPDYSPEAKIVVPQEKLLDVRLDETVAIEVEANDPDFGLADVQLRGQVQGRDVLTAPLLKLGQKDRRVSSRYRFKPSEHGLKAGDVVEYWVAANDIRAPKPNSAESSRQQFRVVSPNPQQQPLPDGGGQNPQQGQQGKGQQGQPGEQGEEQPQDGKAGRGDQRGGQADSGKGEGERGGQREGERGRGGDSNVAQQGDQSKNGGEQPASQDAQRSADPGNASQNQQGDQNAPAGNESQPRQNQPGQQGQQSGQQSQPGEQKSDDKQTGAGAADGEPSNGAQPDGARPDAGNSQKSESTAQSGNQQNGPRQPSDQQRNQNSEQSPVSSDGDNDGEAFERIQKHMERNGEMQEGGGEGETGRQGESGGEQNYGSDQNAGENQQAGETQQTNEKKDGAQDQDQGEDQAGQENPGEQGAGSGAETKGGEPEADNEQAGDKNEQAKSQGGQQTSTKGESGAGDEQKNQGAPNSKPEMKPTQKREQRPSQSENSNSEEPPAGGRGKKESDSQGEQGGDRSGGGEEGGGQKAPREGTGSAGQNQSADEGAGESSEKGAGSNSQNAGKDAVAEKETGQSSGETSGRGHKTSETGEVKPEPGEKQEPGPKVGDPLHRETPTSEESGASEDGNKSDKDGGKTGQDSESPAQNGNRAANQSGTPDGSGGGQGTDMAAPKSIGTAPEGDEANLEYARKQTDLVLEKLSNQLNRKKIDKDLLKKLGWSEEDLKKFVDRWQDRKQAAQRNDRSSDTAKRELDEALRSLGLRRDPLKQGRVKDDTMRDLREGYRGNVPLEYQDRLRAYNQGVSRAQADDE